MDLSALAQRQRTDARAAEVRRSQRHLSPIQTGVVTGLGDRPTVSIVGGAAVVAHNLGGVLRIGDVIAVQSDGLSYWIRGAQSV
jgi:hypothetical protein